MDPIEYDVMARVEDRHWWWRARRDILSDFIGRFAPTPTRGARRLVEVGCGSGGNLPMLSRFGEVLGAEHDAHAIDQLRRKRGGAFRVIRHTIPDPLPGPFDVLAMFDVLEHIRDDEAALDWAARQLSPGGVLIATVPAFGFLWTEQDDAVHHFRRYTPATLAKRLPHNLELLHLTCFNTILFAPIATVRAAMNVLSRRNRPPRSHLGMPPAPINSLFYHVFRQERHLLRRIRFPVGVSVLLVARHTTD